MTDSDRAILQAELKVAEGYRENAYQDTEGVWTIGYGTNLQELTIDKTLAEHWLNVKLQEAERECGRLPFYANLDPARQRVLVELMYNLGWPRLTKFVKMLTALARHDFQTAATELLDSRWAEQVGPVRSLRIAKTLRGA